MQMHLSSDVQIPDGLLAANALLAENSRRGSWTYSGTLHQGFEVAISSTSLGIIDPLYDGDVRSRCTGKERDAESGLDYFGARYYASSMGRWMSPDWSAKASAVPYAKLDNPQSLNLYQYMRNNPLSGVDPDGHSPDWWQKLVNGVSGNGFQTNAQLHPPTVSTTQGPGTANPYTVTLNSRTVQGDTPAQAKTGSAVAALGVQHQWISTSTGQAAGMGDAAGVPNGGSPVGEQTMVVNHTGEVPTSSVTITGVDPGAMSSYLQVGTPTGQWLPGLNDCNTWAANAIQQSTPHDILNMGDPDHGIAPQVVGHNVVVYADGSVHQPQ
jgi:RHS repeat-associated protein